MSIVKSYFLLVKPGIIVGNLITAAAGFFLASRGEGSLGEVFAPLAALAFVIASASVFNNFIDRPFDVKMQRTKSRPSVTGQISLRKGIIFALSSLLLGLLIFAFYSNLSALLLAALGHFIYVVCYSPLKWGFTCRTMVGSLSGALPPLVGYTAGGRPLDGGAFLLFSLLYLWQLPHFFSIALYRREEYAAASLPLPPLKEGKVYLVMYIAAFMLGAPLLTLFGYTGWSYLIVSLFLGTIWLGLAIGVFLKKGDKVWIRRSYVFSLVVLITLSFMISIDG